LQVELVDFGAAREYSKAFIDNWLHLLQAAASDDFDACVCWSRELGYLTGEENEVRVVLSYRSFLLLS
jgi:aarF domain-containing kinase